MDVKTAETFFFLILCSHIQEADESEWRGGGGGGCTKKQTYAHTERHGTHANSGSGDSSVVRVLDS